MNETRFRRNLHAWFRTSGRDLPWRHTRDPYAVMVSEFMAQQTQIATVVAYYGRWMTRFPTVESLAAAGEQDVLSIWQGLGYYARGRNLLRAARAIVAEHGGRVPESREALEALPGFGPYTAAAVAAFAFDQRIPVIDTNVARVLARLTNDAEPIDNPAGRRRLETVATRLLPPRGGGYLHASALMELGALVCTARQPACGICPVRSDCAATAPGEIPVKRPRRRTEAVTESCAFVERGGGVLFEKVELGRWHGLWRLPLLLANEVPAAPPAYEASYGILHYRVQLRVFRVAAPHSPGLFVPASELEELPIPAPHRRAVAALRAKVHSK